MTPDSRFNPPRSHDRHCLNCQHGFLDIRTDKVHCQHPLRPVPKGTADRVEVIRWAVGCNQHEKQ